MNWIDCKDSAVTGEIAYRILKNYCRLESEIYRQDKIFTMDQNNWPGDWEGRTILALVIHAQVTKREPAYLEEIIRKLPEHFNQYGYMGLVREEGEADEQQLSGHNWLLRGLMAYAQWKNDSIVWSMAENIVNSLYKPTGGLYASYPVQKREIGKAAGNIKGKEGQWYLSTDTGCAFISMDALAEYYEKTRDSEVGKLLKEMIQSFSKIDIVGTAMQTHATLSALRGILRFYGVVGKVKYLEYAESVFGLYQTYGMTANYANQNWFGKPLWTEPCAIVDSYMVAMKLFQYTGKVSYLELAHKIYYNALCFAQRYNGGFGCDVCTGEKEKILQVQKDIFEAYWCCTMRGAEGLREMAADTLWIAGDTIHVLNQNNIQTKVRGIELTLLTSYPEKGRFTLSADGGKPSRLKVFIPEFGRSSLNISQKGDNSVQMRDEFLEIIYKGGHLRLDVEFTIPLIEDFIQLNGQAYTRFWRGEQMLGILFEETSNLAAELLEAASEEVSVKMQEKVLGVVLETRMKKIPKELRIVTLDRMIDMKDQGESESVKIQILFPRRGKNE